MNDKLLILEDTDGDGKADKMHRLRRRPALPDRLRVLQRRRPRRPGARPDVPQGHRRRRQGRRPRARAARPRLGRHAPHRQQLRARPGRRALLPGRHVPPHAGRDALRPAACAAPTPASSATSRGRRSSTSTSPYGFANPHGHVFDRWGQDIVVDGTGADPYHGAAVLGPPRLSRTSTPGRRRSTSSGPGPAPASRSSPAGTSPTEIQGNLLVANVIGFQGILQYKIDDKGASFAGDRGRADPLVDRPELPPVGPRRSARTARSTSSTGRTRSSATCSTTSATRAATAIHGRIYRVTYEGRPLLKPAKIAGEPIEKLLDLLKEPEDRVRYRARIELSGRRQRRGHRRGRRSGSPASTRTTRDYEHHLLEALWLHQSHNVVERRPARSACWARPTSAPAPRRRACCATGATACPTRSTCSRSWRPTSTRASGSRRSGPPASSPCPRRSRSP